ncbi:MAG TPA: hypothetical protein VGE47_17205 [Burkholderiaceae bacterium]
MHLVIPNAAGLGDAASAALQTLNLPHLSALLGRLDRVDAEFGSDELSLDTPAELALAAARGWTAEPGCLPWGAASASADGVDVDNAAWALMTPVHLAVGSEQTTLLLAEALSEADSRRLLEDLAGELFPAAEQWRHAFGAAGRWYVAHPSLQGAASASLERVQNRAVDTWLPSARVLRRLQNEVQMLLHRHPLNAEREARGLAPINSVWISGCGALQAGAAALQTDDRLREPLLNGDWQSWCEAWQALDAALPQLHDISTLTLCGERRARRFVAGERSGLRKIWERIAAPSVDPLRVLSQL